jgi:signal transduction histidine kinase
VLFKKNQSSISVIIEDTGVGFDPRKVRSEQGKNNRLGLYGMEERLAIVGGNLVVESSPGAGTTIYIDIPLG